MDKDQSPELTAIFAILEQLQAITCFERSQANTMTERYSFYQNMAQNVEAIGNYLESQQGLEQ